MEKRELVIIGAGPAGLTSAIYGRRAGLDVLLLEKGIPGGQINITDEIENWPGVIHSSGSELGVSFRKHAEHFKTEFRDCTVSGIEIRNGSKIVITDKGEVEAEAIILATGASFRKLGCKGEAEFTGGGVSYCAVCDAAFFEDETIAVVGGGNVAVEEAGYLTRFASKVYIIHRREEFRADRHAIEQALSNPKIEPIWNSVVESIEGEGLVEKLVLKNVKTGEVSDLPVAGVFIFVGTEPNVSYLGEPGSVVNQTHGGWIDTNDKMETSAIKRLLGEHGCKVMVQSTKSMVGHLLGAAGAVETIAALLAIQESIVHPTIHQFDPDPECDLNTVPNKAVRAEVNKVLINNFGFGGHNGVLAIERFKD